MSQAHRGWRVVAKREGLVAKRTNRCIFLVDLDSRSRAFGRLVAIGQLNSDPERDMYVSPSLKCSSRGISAFFVRHTLKPRQK